ncbi:molybdopterin-dependent oxidoreductase [Belnapia sp. T18]|uniref:Molybdopterin-dependent oxidoreductase n=1 Tax=Belnapia arida TaxID=2804533 RepID=A0ABS1UBF9_9PROT|nr:molybdopterin-dependent oxidoreductase [Belnapia arida]MBL6082018.1 molybdopterin-dependent oxidoreductase [Belnapia arida]
MLCPFGINSGLIVRSVDPFNAEPHLRQPISDYVTPQSEFYVRSHGEIPRLDATTYHLRVTGKVQKPLELSMEALRHEFPRHTVNAVMQRAGNRRGDLLQVAPVSGDPWSAGAIGNARRGGIVLADVLRAAGVDDGAGLHVAFNSLDDCKVNDERFRFGVSIPMAKAMAPEVLLAFEMNGEALHPSMAFPYAPSCRASRGCAAQNGWPK